jgi:hypothetical protein
MRTPRGNIERCAGDHRGELFGHRAGYQHVVTRGGNQGGGPQLREVRRRVERQQRGDAPPQRVGALEAGESVRFLPGGALGVLRQPVGGIEEDRLSPHVGGGPFVLQQQQSQFEAALGVSVRRRPAVDHGQRIQALRMTDRDVEASEAAQRVADDMGSAGFRRVSTARISSPIAPML